MPSVVQAQGHGKYTAKKSWPRDLVLLCFNFMPVNLRQVWIRACNVLPFNAFVKH